MSEANDAIVPILRNIQQRLSAMEGKLDGLDAKSKDQSEAFEAVRTYITYTIGLHSENKVDIETLNKWKADVERRLALLETQRHP